MDQVSTSAVLQLLESVTQAANAYADLSVRRSEVLAKLQSLTEAAAGYWAWGHSDKNAASVMPVALIPFGFTAAQMAAYVEFSVAPETYREFVEPIKQRMQDRAQIAVTRQDIFDATTWNGSFMKRSLAQIGFSEWVQCVRYSRSETWSQLFLLRTAGQSPFRAEDRALVDVAMAGISWLHSSQGETMKIDEMLGLTSRQRAVLLMLLDGLSRKQIACRFVISEQTVGDHIKQIYRHFEVNSAGELAARFLRSR